MMATTEEATALKSKLEFYSFVISQFMLLNCLSE